MRRHSAAVANAAVVSVANTNGKLQQTPKSIYIHMYLSICTFTSINTSECSHVVLLNLFGNMYLLLLLFLLVIILLFLLLLLDIFMPHVHMLLPKFVVVIVIVNSRTNLRWPINFT